MITLHSGRHLLLKEDRDGSLVLDIKTVGELTDAQVRKFDGLMFPAGEDTWFGEPEKKAEVLALVRQVDQVRDADEPWTSLAERTRAQQQREGGR